MALLLPKLSKSSGSSVRINVWRQRRACVAPVGKVFPKSPGTPKKPDETLDLTTIGLSEKYNLLFPVVGKDRIPPRPMDYKKITDNETYSEAYCTAPNLPELPGLPGERRGQKQPPKTGQPDFCLKGEGQALPSYVIGASKIENSLGGTALKNICSQLQSWFESLSRQKVDDTNIQEELKRLLYIKKMRIYLEVRKKIYSPEVHCVPIFHCPCCLEHWTVTGWAPVNCPNSIQPTRGPDVVMYGTKMRFISMHPKGKANVVNKKQDYPRKKLGGSTESPYLGKDSKDESQPSSTNSSRASNHPSRDPNEGAETTQEKAKFITGKNSTEKMNVNKEIPSGLDPRNGRHGERTETMHRRDANEREGIPKSRASMSLIRSISCNDDHYNEYARASSRQSVKTNEWKRKSTSNASFCPDHSKMMGKAPKQTTPISSILAGKDDDSKITHQQGALTPLLSNDSLIEDQEDSATGNSDTSQNHKAIESPENINMDALESTFDPQDLNVTVQTKLFEKPQSKWKGQLDKPERKCADVSAREADGSSDNNRASVSSSHEDMERLSTRETNANEEVPVSRHSTLKKFDSINLRREKINVTWYDRKSLSKDSITGSDKDISLFKSIEALSAVSPPSGEESTQERNFNANTREISLLPKTDYFKEATEELQKTEEEYQKQENEVTKHSVEKSESLEYNLADLHSHERVKSSAIEHSEGKPDRDSDTPSRDNMNTFTAQELYTERRPDESSANKKSHHSISKKGSLSIEGAQEGFSQHHRRRTEMFIKKERKHSVKRPKRAYKSKEMPILKSETLTVKPQAFIQPHVAEATAWYKEGCLAGVQNTYHTQDISGENDADNTAVLPLEHAQGLVKDDVDDEFHKVDGDIRNDIELVDLEFSSPGTPTVQRGNKMDANIDDVDDDDEIFEEIDIKTALFAKRIPNEIQRLPVSNAFTFSFYELPKQYKKQNKKIERAAFTIGSVGGRSIRLKIK